MSESSDSGEPKPAGTLLGVPAPRIDSTPDSATRKPVFVRAGTSVEESDNAEPLPLPRMALPSRPLLPHAPVELPSDAPPAFARNGSLSPTPGTSRWLGLAQRYPVLWMAAAPALAAVGIVSVLMATSSPRAKPTRLAAVTASPAALGSAAKPASAQRPSPDSLAALEAKPLSSLSAEELVDLAEARTARRRDAAQALRKKLAAEPAQARDKAVQAELFKLASDPDTARDALATMSKLEGSLGADLLYEVWTGTTAKTDATELARALVYSTDVRPKASAALAVALQLREAESCEQAQAALPKALKDGDRRSLHLLSKLAIKRGCGPKKSQDCYVCLRDDAAGLSASINAVKARPAPAYPAP